jgi:ABC-type thiamin/hydroxymethylpyrimidine transport system permease subunit
LLYFYIFLNVEEIGLNKNKLGLSDLHLHQFRGYYNYITGFNILKLCNFFIKIYLLVHILCIAVY